MLLKGFNPVRDDIEKCPVCGHQALVTITEDTIYCTSCPLQVNSSEMRYGELKDFWNNLKIK